MIRVKVKLGAGPGGWGSDSKRVTESNELLLRVRVVAI